MSDDLLKLAERVEAATGPDRALDGEIMFELFAKPVAGGRGYLWPEDNPSWSFALAMGKPVDQKIKDRSAKDAERYNEPPKEWIEFQRDGRWILMNSLRVPRLTASLDAAMTLVPEGWGWHLYSDGPTYRASAEIGLHPTGGAMMQVEAASEGDTPALALTAASLRARHQQGQSE